MASDWIKWVKGLAKRREVRIMARSLNVSRKEIAGTLMEVWEWADGETCDGHIKGATPSDLDDIAEIAGFAEAMAHEDVQWLLSTPGGITFPNWDNHNSESAKQRARNQKNKSKSRHRSVTDPSLLAGDKTVTREEKRREEPESVIHAGGREPAERAEILSLFERWLNVSGKASVNWGPVITWLASVEDFPLAKRCAEHAIASPQAQPHNASGAVRYVQAIYERCRQHQCEPGDFGDSNHGKTDHNRSRIRSAPGKFAGLAKVCGPGRPVPKPDDPHPQPSPA